MLDSPSAPQRIYPRRRFKLVDLFRQVFNMSTPDPRQRSLVHIATRGLHGSTVNFSFANTQIDVLQNCNLELFEQLHATTWRHYKVDQSPEHEFLVFGISLLADPVGTLISERSNSFRQIVQDQSQTAEASSAQDEAASPNSTPDNEEIPAKRKATWTSVSESGVPLYSMKGVVAQDSITLSDVHFKSYTPSQKCSRLQEGQLHVHIPLISIYAVAQAFHEEFVAYRVLRHQCFLFAATVLHIITQSQRNSVSLDIQEARRIVARDMAEYKRDHEDFGTFKGLRITTAKDVTDAIERVGPAAAIIEEQLKARLEFKKGEAKRAKEEAAKNEEEARKAKEEAAEKDEALAKKDEELAKKDEELAKKDEEMATKDEEARKAKEEARRAKEESAKKDEEMQRMMEEMTRMKEAMRGN